jgi:hypothetical protein
MEILMKNMLNFSLSLLIFLQLKSKMVVQNLIAFGGGHGGPLYQVHLQLRKHQVHQKLQ